MLPNYSNVAMLKLIIIVTYVGYEMHFIETDPHYFVVTRYYSNEY